MTEPHPEQNGHQREPTEADRIGEAVANRIASLTGQVLPQVFNALPAMIGQAIAQQQQRGWCATCVKQRMTWEHRHRDALDAALQLAAKAAGVPGDDPRLVQMDPAPFLPAELQPGSGHAEEIPRLADWVTQEGGTLFCAQHVPGLEGPQGKRPFLIAHAGMIPK